MYIGSTMDFESLGAGSRPAILEIRGLNLYYLLYQSNSFVRHISIFVGGYMRLGLEGKCVICIMLESVEGNFFIIDV